MSDGENAVVVATPVWAERNYPFNEPPFVTWWLGSLYLFPEEIQLEIAARLRESVHDLAVRAEIDGFLAYTSGQALEPVADLQSSDADEQNGNTFVVGAMAKLRELFRESPWVVGVGVVGLLLAVGKGVWLLATGFLKVVF